MFWNNVKIAIRNLSKHKGFAAINIFGLAIGMTIFVFGSLLVRYEQTHDAFYENSDRIYTIGVIAQPNSELPVSVMNSVQSAAAPIIKAELPDIEAAARTIYWEYLVTMGADSFYEELTFADPELLEIFDFVYLHGDQGALDSPSGILVSESAATKYFGRTDVVGETITLDNEHDFVIEAVMKDVPQNSHFKSSPIIEAAPDIVLPLSAAVTLRDFDMAGNWSNLSLGNMTYVMLPETLDQAWLQNQLDGIYERLMPEKRKEYIAGFTTYQLQEANLSIWDSFGMPMDAVIQILSLLVLIVACVNYTNLATAQSLGRSREVGMRKTMGADRAQLLAQFLVESIVVAAIAMVVAIAALEVVVPLFNNATNKVLALDYLRILPFLIVTTVVVGGLAGLYPAWLITRASPIDALRDIARKGKKGSAMRALMIGAQFAISAFMLAIVSIIYMQNEKVKEESYVFPRAEIYTLGRVGNADMSDRLETLRLELTALPNVASVAYSSQVPYEQSNSTSSVTAQPGDEAGKFSIHDMRTTPEFFDTYDIPILAGRGPSREVGNDLLRDGLGTLNVVVNELALRKLGIGSAGEAIGQRFYNLREGDDAREYIIVGVVPTQNIVGLFNSNKPWVFVYADKSLRMGSVRVTGGNIIDTVADIERVWKRVFPDYPMQGRFLDDVFNDVYNVLKYMNAAMAGFAFVALSLALIGLFGLAAFMAAQRTKEIGIRKVLGANSAQIAKLLVWQFSKPVMWALALALPAAYFASNLYLDFFADRIGSPITILAVAGAIAVLLAWGTVAGHAVRIARANPVLALRYE